MTLPDNFRVILVVVHQGYETWLMYEKGALPDKKKVGIDILSICSLMFDIQFQVGCSAEANQVLTEENAQPALLQSS